MTTALNITDVSQTKDPIPTPPSSTSETIIWDELPSALLSKAYEMAKNNIPRDKAAELLGVDVKHPEFVEFFTTGESEILSAISEGMIVNATTPTPSYPGGNLTAQIAVYDRILGREKGMPGSGVTVNALNVVIKF